MSSVADSRPRRRIHLKCLIFRAMTSIRLESLGKDYGSTTAVEAVDLEIESGHLFFLLGPSGCGKTTLLRMIAGFIDPTRGRIAFGGRDVTHVAPNRRNAGMVFQSYALWPHLSVMENVAFGLRVRRVGSTERQARVMKALELVRMEQYAERKPNQLSGGQQQRVALARALVIEPTVLLLDEPLSNLDAKLRLEMRSEIRRICTDLRITTVYVTHDQKEALSMADDVAVLRDGRVVQRGTPDDLYRRPQSRFVADFLGEANFIAGTVATVGENTAAITTSAGMLRSDAVPATPLTVGQDVTISVRPEAVRLTATTEPTPPGMNRLACSIRSRMYLGETAQYVVDVAAGLSMKALELNPRGPLSGSTRMVIDPADVVVIAEVAPVGRAASIA